jgi:hypothetical protein
VSLTTAERTLDLNDLHVRRHAALASFDTNAGAQIEALERRIAAGERKIDEEVVAMEGSPAVPERLAAIDRARLKLAGLWDELQHLRLAYGVPAEVYSAIFSLAESLTKKHLPEGSYLMVAIPGSINISVNLANANEAPF